MNRDLILNTNKPEDRTGGAPNRKKCPNCEHSLGSDGTCQWCGWPDLEGARKRTQKVMEKLKKTKRKKTKISVRADMN